jgi:NADPH-dependent curcumin reductase CurA
VPGSSYPHPGTAFSISHFAALGTPRRGNGISDEQTASIFNFENVGRTVREALWSFLNNDARVPVCGLVLGLERRGVRSWRRCARPPDVADRQQHPPEGQSKRLSFDAFPTFKTQVRGWLDAGHLRASETIVEG